ncbi:MAG: carbohydrate-binding module family 14 protein [Bacteroidales bacterium]
MKNIIKVSLVSIAFIALSFTGRQKNIAFIRAHSKCCASYLLSPDGQNWFIGHCSEGLLFNDEAFTCDWPNNVNCGKRSPDC